MKTVLLIVIIAAALIAGSFKVYKYHLHNRMDDSKPDASIDKHLLETMKLAERTTFNIDSLSSLVYERMKDDSREGRLAALAIILHAQDSLKHTYLNQLNDKNVWISPSPGTARKHFRKDK